jgi:hypothetical protein
LEDLVALRGLVRSAFGDVATSALPGATNLEPASPVADAAAASAPPLATLEARLRDSERAAAAAGAARTNAASEQSSAVKRARLFRLRPASLVAAAAGLLLALVLIPREEEVPVGPKSWAGRVEFRAADAMRSGEDERFHFAWTAPRSGRAAIVRVDADGRARRLYPDPNPLIGAFGRETPFSPGEAVRVPPFATLDFAADEGARTARFFVVFTPAETTPETWTRLDAELARLGATDALAARLAAFGDVAEFAR